MANTLIADTIEEHWVVRFEPKIPNQCIANIEKLMSVMKNLYCMYGSHICHLKLISRYRNASVRIANAIIIHCYRDLSFLSTKSENNNFFSIFLSFFVFFSFSPKCYSHKNLGWKIIVKNKGELALSSSPANIRTNISLPILFLISLGYSYLLSLAW